MAQVRREDLINRRALVTDMGELATVLGAPTFDPAKVGSLCTDINQAMRSANAYFPVPDPSLQTDWSMMINHMTQASADCQKAVQQMDNHLFQTSVTELANVGEAAIPLVQRIASGTR